MWQLRAILHQQPAVQLYLPGWAVRPALAGRLHIVECSLRPRATWPQTLDSVQLAGGPLGT